MEYDKEDLGVESKQEETADWVVKRKYNHLKTRKERVPGKGAKIQIRECLWLPRKSKEAMAAGVR